MLNLNKFNAGTSPNILQEHFTIEILNRSHLDAGGREKINLNFYFLFLIFFIDLKDKILKITMSTRVEPRVKSFKNQGKDMEVGV